MNRSFAANPVRPNLPLRKPSSSPMARSVALHPPRHAAMPAAAPVLPAPSAAGQGPSGPASRGKSAELGSMPPALTIHFCNFCGKQGNFRCTRCKKAPYCSVVCQTEDWKEHRQMCKSSDPDPANQKLKKAATAPLMANNASLSHAQKNGNAVSPRRTYLKDLHMTNVIAGTGFQASVVEFYSPGRFFLLAQNPKLLESLQSICTELQKTYSFSSPMAYVPSIGEVCGVQFSCDLNWYRGLVQNVAADQKTANVLYIDFGNEEDVLVDRIRPLAANIPLYCPCAMECRIAGVVPVVGSWSGEGCVAVRQILAGKTVTVKLVETLKNGRTYSVDIQLSMGKQLSTFLLEHGFGAKETVNVAPTEQDINAMVSASLQNFKRCSDGKDDNTWAQPPEPLKQAVGDSFTVVVTHFQSPSEIIVQKVESAGVIQDLQLKLREHCCQVPLPQNFRPAPGTTCCAQFSEDKQWYRAKVLAYSSEERVCVGYIDFGNSEEVELSHLRPISTSLLALPMQAIPCGLGGVQPVGESWSEDCLLALQRRVSNRLLCTKIQGAHDGKVLVAMIDETSDPQANIAELLISAGYAAPCPAPVNASDEQQANKATLVAEETHASPVSESLVWSSCELPREGQTVALLASVVVNPGEFFCRIHNPTDQQLIALGTELKLHCEADVSPFVPKVGEPCCAMFAGDGAWHRAMVKGQSQDKVMVNFVDYGNSAEVEKRHLRSITPRLLKLPFQAIRCWLSGVEPLGSEWSNEALLWFQALVVGERLTCRVVSVTEQGYGVQLESRGQNVAAALISEQLAKGPKETPEEPPPHPRTSKHHKVVKEEEGQTQVQASQPTASSKEMSTKEAVAASSALSFPVNWKTVELPLNETFQPLIAAVTSPALFYLLVPYQVDQQKLQEVMAELAVYCSSSNNNSPASLPCSSAQSRPTPGAACCAHFSADNNWYRAVVLDVGETEVSVIYADYGNTEKLPLARVLPIPKHLLQLPFQITRCSLSGQEHFPAEWPEQVQKLFQGLLLNGVTASVESFDGSANILSLSLPAERGGAHLTAMILEALQVLTQGDHGPPATVKPDISPSGPAAAPDVPRPEFTHASQKSLENTAAPAGATVTSEPPAQTPEQESSLSAEPFNEDPVQKIEQMEPPCSVHPKTNDPAISGCRCPSLETRIDELEQLMQLQLTLIKQLVGQTKMLKL